MILSLEIENFKSIGKAAKVDFSDITLLYGPNSAGKSSVIQALHYLREVLCFDNVNPQTATSDRQIHLGGFRNLVHKRDLENFILIRCTFSVAPEFDPLRLKDFFINFKYHDDLKFLPGFDRHVKRIGEAIRDNEPLDFDYPEHVALGPLPLKRLPENATISVLVGLDDKGSPWTHEIASDLDGHRVLKLVGGYGACDVQHGRDFLKFLPDFDYDFSKYASEKLQQASLAIPVFLGDEDDVEAYLKSEEARAESAKIRTGERLLIEAWAKIKSTAEAAGRRWTDLARVAAEVEVPKTFEWWDSKCGCFPTTGWWFNVSMPDDNDLSCLSVEEHAERQENFAVQSVNTMCLYGQIISLILQEQLKEELNRVLHVGPLRARQVEPAGHDQDSQGSWFRGWYDGQAAWAALAKSEGLCEATSEWLSSQEQFSTPYRVRVRKTRRIVEGGRLQELLAAGASSESLREAIEQISPELDAVLVDSLHGIELKSADVGTGISQMLPIVVAALAPGSYLAVFEQPELHLHPKAQLAIADLLIHAVNTPERGGKQFLIETHSEHLALRMLRRIRETSDGELGDEDLRLLPEKVAINYLLPAEEGVHISRLRIDEGGEFIDRWPAGFFDERAEELF